MDGSQSHPIRDHLVSSLPPMLRNNGWARVTMVVVIWETQDTHASPPNLRGRHCLHHHHHQRVIIINPILQMGRLGSRQFVTVPNRPLESGFCKWGLLGRAAQPGGAANAVRTGEAGRTRPHDRLQLPLAAGASWSREGGAWFSSRARRSGRGTRRRRTQGRCRATRPTRGAASRHGRGLG